MKKILYALSFSIIIVSIGLGLIAVKRRNERLGDGSDNTMQLAKSKSDEYVGTLKKYLSKSGFNGSSVLVKDGKVVDSYVIGNANDDENIENTLTTTYEIDSLQKALTAGMVMKQIKLGVLKFDDRLSKFFPQMIGANEITIRNLLDMTSGLSISNQKFSGDSLSSEQLMRRVLNKVKFNSDNLGVWNYQPVNYVVLSEIVQKVTGRTYAQLFSNIYVDALNLKQTEMAYSDAEKTYRATGYVLKDDNGILKKEEQNPNKATIRSEMGTGQVYMSVIDYYKAISRLLDGKTLGKKNANSLFQFKVTEAINNSKDYYGGLYTSKIPSYRFANGYGYGFQDHVRISKDGKNALIVFSNYQRYGDGKLKKAVNKLSKEFFTNIE